jgi:hypothetical protein
VLPLEAGFETPDLAIIGDQDVWATAGARGAQAQSGPPMR